MPCCPHDVRQHHAPFNGRSDACAAARCTCTRFAPEPYVSRYVLLYPADPQIVGSEEKIVHLDRATTEEEARADARSLCADLKWTPWKATLLDGRTGERIPGFHVLTTTTRETPDEIRPDRLRYRSTPLPSGARSEPR